MCTFYVPWKHQETERLPMFSEGKNGNNCQRRLNRIYNTKIKTCLENFIFISICCFMRPGGGWGEVKEKEGLKLVENSFQSRRC